MRTNREKATMLILLAVTAALLSVYPGAGPAWAADELTPPKVIPSSVVNPVYPEAERAAGIQGTVLLGVDVRADGTVGGLKAVEQVEGHPAFTASAIAAVGKWRFEPATQGDRPVACSIKVPVRFVLDCKKK